VVKEHAGEPEHCKQESWSSPQTKSLYRSPRLQFHRMRNTNGRKTASIAPPVTRIAAYLVDPTADLLLRLHAVARILGKYFVFPAVDAAKCKDVPLRLSGLHRKAPVGVGTGAFDSQYTLTGELRKRSFGSRRSGEKV